MPLNSSLLSKRDGPKKTVRIDVPGSPTASRTQTLLSETTKHFSDDSDDDGAKE